AIFSMLEAEAYRREVLLSPDAPPGQMLAGAAWPRVLDLYAGTGALGIEALSRGARAAEFVENDAEPRKALATSLARTRLAEYAALHALSVERAISTWDRPYDLILLDPRYADPSVLGVMEALGRSRLLGPHSVVVLEHARELVPLAEAGRLALQ